MSGMSMPREAESVETMTMSPLQNQILLLRTEEVPTKSGIVIGFAIKNKGKASVL